VTTNSFRISLFLPSQAAAETEATITRWNVREGARFTKGQVLAEIESAKATFDFEAPCDGTVVKLLFAEGATASFEMAVMEIETADESMKSGIPSAQASTQGSVQTTPVHVASENVQGDNKIISILGIGGYVPDRVVTNKELLKEFPAVTEEYIFGVTGIRERRWAKEGEKPSEMALHASLEAIKKSGLEPKDIGAIVVATGTPDVVMPSTACILQDLLGVRGIPSFDLSAACSGWLYALSVAKGLIATGIADDILVVGVELQSQLLDKTDMGTYFLFGDGAGAAVVSSRKGGHAITEAVLRADAKGLQLAKRTVCGFKIPLGVENLNPWIRIDGHALFRFATGGFASIIQEVVEKSKWKLDDVSWVVPHQANSRILKTAAQKAGIPFEKFFINIGRFGNTSSASIPLALIELQPDLRPGDKLVLCSVGAGVTVAALSIEW
jgi:3-oxoacyl-(acyl-carrier-protein) synthase III